MSTNAKSIIPRSIPQTESQELESPAPGVSGVVGRKLPKKRIGKREAMKKLVDENNELKALIGKMQQQIAAVEAQNLTMEKEIIFFHKQIMDTMPLRPELKEKGLELLGKTTPAQNV